MGPTGVLLQVNVAPSLSIFPKALAISAQFQQYRISNVSYDIAPLNIVNTLTGMANSAADQQLVYLYDVPIYGNEIPAVSIASYNGFANLKMTLLDRQV